MLKDFIDKWILKGKKKGVLSNYFEELDNANAILKIRKLLKGRRTDTFPKLNFNSSFAIFLVQNFQIDENYLMQIFCDYVSFGEERVKINEKERNILNIKSNLLKILGN
jgi:hypothetical protein